MAGGSGCPDPHAESVILAEICGLLGPRIDLQGVNVGGHQIAHGIIDKLVSFEGGAIFEFWRFDQNEKMRAAVAGAGMADMFFAVVPDFQPGWLERFQSFPQQLDAFLIHGKTL